MTSFETRIGVSIVLIMSASCNNSVSSSSPTNADAIGAADNDNNVFTADVAASLELLASSSDLADIATSEADIGAEPIFVACPTQEGLAKADLQAKACAGALTCGIDPSFCCGQKFYLANCKCLAGIFSCSDTSSPKFCSGDSGCSPGCPFGQYTSPKGCLPCKQLVPQLKAIVQKIVATGNACSVDQDCWLGEYDACATPCAVALSKAVSATKLEEIKVAIDGWCSLPPATGLVNCHHHGTGLPPQTRDHL